MSPVDIIVNILISSIPLITFNVLIFFILYLAYKVEVRNFNFDFHLRLLNKILVRWNLLL